MNAGFVDGFPFADDVCDSLSIADCSGSGESVVQVVALNQTHTLVFPPRVPAGSVFGLLSGGLVGYIVDGGDATLCSTDTYAHLPMFPFDVAAIAGFSNGTHSVVSVAFGNTVAQFHLTGVHSVTASSMFTAPSKVIDLHWSGGLDGSLSGLAESGPFSVSSSGVVAAAGTRFGTLFTAATVTYWDTANGFAAFADKGVLEVWGCSASWIRLSRQPIGSDVEFITLCNGTGLAYSVDGQLWTFHTESSSSSASPHDNDAAAHRLRLCVAANATAEGSLGLVVVVSGSQLTALAAAYPYECEGSASPKVVSASQTVPGGVIAVRSEGGRGSVLVLAGDGAVLEVSRIPTPETLKCAMARQLHHLGDEREIVTDRWQSPTVLADAVWLGLRTSKDPGIRSRLCALGDSLMGTSMQYGRITLSPLVRRAMRHSGLSIIGGDQEELEAHFAALNDFFVQRGWSETTAAKGLHPSEFYLSFPEIILTARKDLSPDVQLALQGMVLEHLVRGVNNLLRYGALTEATSEVLGSHSKHHPLTVCWGQPNVFHDVVNDVLVTRGGPELLLSTYLDDITLHKAKICNLIEVNNTDAAIDLVAKFAVSLHQDGGGGLRCITRLLKDARPTEPMEVIVLATLVNVLRWDVAFSYWDHIESILDVSTDPAEWFAVATALLDTLKAAHLPHLGRWILRQQVQDRRLLQFAGCYEQLVFRGVRQEEVPMSWVLEAVVSGNPQRLLNLASSRERFSLADRQRLVEVADGGEGFVSLRRHLELQAELLGCVADDSRRSELEGTMCDTEVLVEFAGEAGRFDIQVEVVCVDGVEDEGMLEDAIHRLAENATIPLEQLLARIHVFIGTVAPVLLRMLAPYYSADTLLQAIAQHTSAGDAIEAAVAAVEHALQQDAVKDWPVEYLVECEGLFRQVGMSDDAQFLAMRLGDAIRRLVGLARLGHMDVDEEDVARLSEIESQIDVPV